MLDDDSLLDLLAQIEKRGDLERYPSIKELIAADAERRVVLEGSQELAEQLSASFSALRSQIRSGCSILQRSCPVWTSAATSRLWLVYANN